MRNKDQFRTAVRADLAHPELVETRSNHHSSAEGGGGDPLSSKTGGGNERITHRHIIKIFTGDHEYTEVSREQLERVRKMHDSIESNVRFCFNYNALLLVASVLAGLGLVSNSSATIIASMLVSPLSKSAYVHPPVCQFL
jgi:hypothetical protein